MKIRLVIEVWDDETQKMFYETPIVEVKNETIQDISQAFLNTHIMGCLVDVLSVDSIIDYAKYKEP